MKSDAESEGVIISMNRQQLQLLTGLHDLFITGDLADVTLMADDLEVACHKNILAASSPYFRAMFTIDVRENEQKIIPLHGISKKALELAIKFMYTGDIIITNDNVQSVMTAANMLQLDTLLDSCVEHMAKELYIENCLDVYNFADFHCLPELKTAAKHFILDHFAEVAERKEILQVDRTIFTDFISSDEVSVDKEEMVFELLVRWVEYNEENRKTCFPTLFSLVRLPLIEREYIASTIETHKLVVGNPYCRGLLCSAKLFRIGLENQLTGGENVFNDMQINAIPRQGMFKHPMLVFSGGADSAEQRSFTCFDPVTRKNYCGIKHHPTFDFKFKIDHYRITVTEDNEIFFLGGIFYENHHFEDQGLALDTVYRYTPKKRAWNECKRMNTPRCAFATCISKERIFVFGGLLSYPQGVPLNAVECFDPVHDEWYVLSSLPVGIVHHTATMFKEDIYIFGGIDDDGEYLNTVLHYSVFSDTWSLVRTEMLNPRAESSAITYKDKIYLVGGCSKHQNMLTVHIYNPQNNKWHCGSDFPDERKCLAVTLLGDFIYVCGGIRHLPTRPGSSRRSRSVETKDLYKYDPEKNEWSKEVKMVQYGSNQAMIAATVNTKYLEESEFVSSLSPKLV